MSVSNCRFKYLIKALNLGQIEDEARIEEFFEHADQCEICQRELHQLNPSQLENEIRELFSVDAGTVDLDTIKSQLDADEPFTEELSKLIEIPPRMPSAFEEEDYERLRRNESGHFFHSFLAADYSSGLDVNLKLPRLSRIKSQDQEYVFICDAQKAKALNHPNIVPTIHFGRWNESRWFLTTRWISAPLFAQWLAQAPPSLELAINILSQICSAISYARSKGVIHRHLDHRNVFIEADGHVWITDFGFLLDSRYQFDLFQPYKEVSNFLGPEFEKLTEPMIDERSDVFSIGKFFEVLLSWSENDITGKPSEITQDDFCTVIATCGRLSRRSRFQSVDELIQAVRSVHPSLNEFGSWTDS